MTPFEQFLQSPLSPPARSDELMSSAAQMPMSGAAGMAQMPMPQRGGEGASGMTQEAVERKIKQFIQQRPDVMQQVSAEVQNGVMTGELSYQELQEVGDLALTVLALPSLYPQVRAYALQSGAFDEEDLPPVYDEGVVIALIIASRLGMAAIGGMDMGQPASEPSMAAGLVAMPNVGLSMGGYSDGLLEKDH